MAETLQETRPRGRVRRWAGALAMLSLATLALSGCGGDSSDEGTPDMGLEWTFTPAPATAEVSGEAGYDWVAPYRVTLQETGGQGGTVTDVTVNVYENGDGEVGAEATAAKTDLEFDTTRIEPRGTTELDFSTHYTFASESRAAIIDIFIFLVDDEGRQAQVGSRLVVD
jgi:hypothetical protein